MNQSDHNQIQTNGGQYVLCLHKVYTSSQILEPTLEYKLISHIGYTYGAWGTHAKVTAIYSCPLLIPSAFYEQHLEIHFKNRIWKGSLGGSVR